MSQSLFFVESKPGALRGIRGLRGIRVLPGIRAIAGFTRRLLVSYLSPPAPHGPISPAELLGRDEIAPDPAALAPAIRGRCVLITGAGGTMGRELAHQIAPLGPARLVLLDHAEHALWRAGQDLGARHPGVPARPVLADIRDAARIRAVCAEFRPDIVLHAAALKHVPMVEDHPAEGLLTNAIGTRIVVEAARAAGARAVLLLSTDKAVLPACVMGAGKRLAELACLAADRGGGGRVLTVRFGNVLGSSGSVLELWQDQLARGAALSLTHPDMRRYVTTPREAAGLILRALALGLAGDVPRGGLCVLDMGAPVRVADLARRLAGAAAPPRPLRFAVTGPRPGEKLSEALLHAEETARPIGVPGLLLAEPGVPAAEILARALDELEALCRAGQVPLALGLVSRLIPGFRPGTACRDGRKRA